MANLTNCWVGRFTHFGVCLSVSCEAVWKPVIMTIKPPTQSANRLAATIRKGSAGAYREPSGSCSDQASGAASLGTSSETGLLPERLRSRVAQETVFALALPGGFLIVLSCPAILLDCLVRLNRRKNCCRWSMMNCADWPRPAWPMNSQGTLYSPRRSSTKLG